jgi:hypothetical protein
MTEPQTANRKSLWPVLALAALNSVVWNGVDLGIPQTAADACFNFVRVALMVWAGWVVVRRGSTLWDAGWAAVAVILVDHLLVKGGVCLVEHALGNSSADLSYLMGFWGVMFSFLLGSPVAAAIGLFGGLLARRSDELSAA